LILVFNVPLEQDQAPRTGFAQKARSSAVNVRPDSPEMKARGAIGAD